MRIHRKNAVLLAAAVVALLASGNLLGQRNRITGRPDNSRRVTLRDHVHPQIEGADDQGEVEQSMPLNGVTLVLKPSDAQQADLEKFLASQQDPMSADYHRWLTPEQYAERFGASQDDIDKLTAWLKDQNLAVTNVARARNRITFDGTAAAVEAAFGTKIHRYAVRGELRYANATAPSVPVAFEAVIGSIAGLTNFRLKPARKRPFQPLQDKPGSTEALTPNFLSSRGANYLAPGDFSVIYNTKPMLDSGIDGSGVKIAVVGQTAITLSDVQQFRSYFGLPAKDPQVVLVPGSRDPGILSGDQEEANLDIEWAGGTAPNADIVYVYSTDVMNSVQYAVDQNVAPIISMSYGLCELQTATSDARSMQALARQANAQGITWFAASGDSGATDCLTGTGRTNNAGLSVDLPAGIPEVTGIGGTTFNEGSGSYWGSANIAGSRASALSYIPETVWNDSAPGDPSSGGGGASLFFTKPAWQAGPGVPNDGVRDVPDVSLSASAQHVGYMVYHKGALGVIGGTSAGAPSFAGITALLNHYLLSKGTQSIAGLGNINPKLYALAQTSPAVFHDVTTGNNIIAVTCTARSRNCVPGSYGYSAGPGYDLASGLGSVDAAALIAAWGGQTSSITKGNATLTLAASAASLTVADPVTLTATVRSANGGTPQGTVTFSQAGVALGTVTLSGSGGVSTAVLTLNGGQFAAGPATITAEYSGDASYSGASGTAVITVSALSAGPPAISNLANGASFARSFAPGMILSVFGTNLSPVSRAADAVPLPTQISGVSATVNGVTAPLYYVSPSQMNIQIPYEVTANTTAVLRVNNNGRTASVSFPIAVTAPGVFMDANSAPVPYTRAARGSIITLFLTGAGAVSPFIGTGAAPPATQSNLPKPLQTVSVTVGNASAPVAFAGIPPGLVGVVQVNYQVPANAPLGSQPVVVSVGGIASQRATLVVTQ